MAQPLDNVRAGMTGRHEVIVTRELTGDAHVDGVPFVRLRHPDDDPGDGDGFCGGCGAAFARGLVTVGSEVNVRHLAPTPVGRTVVATAEVVEVSGRSMLLAVEAHDGVQKVGAGTHRRGVVNLETFARRLSAGWPACDGDAAS
jgi:fluoroacetyl-CoA thioesterase